MNFCGNCDKVQPRIVCCNCLNMQRYELFIACQTCGLPELQKRAGRGEDAARLLLSQMGSR